MTATRPPRFDWPALRSVLEQMFEAKTKAERGKIVDYRKVPASQGANEYRIEAITLINAVSMICCRLAEEKSLEKEQHAVAVFILRMLLTPGKTRRAERNADIRKKDESNRKNDFHTPISEGISDLSKNNELSDRQVRKIANTCPSPIESFMSGDDAPASLAAALKELARLRKTLLAHSGKGEALRSLAVFDFADIGATILTDEFLDDVDSLVATGMKKKDAYAEVSAYSGLSIAQIRTAHQRRDRQRKTDFNNIVAADRERALQAGIPTLNRDEYEPKSYSQASLPSCDD